MVIQFDAEQLRHKKIIASVLALKYSADTVYNLEQEGYFGRFKQYVATFDNKRYLIYEHCEEDFKISGHVNSVYFINWQGFPLKDFLKTNYCHRHLKLRTNGNIFYTFTFSRK
jgi:hypothetical protein